MATATAYSIDDLICVCVSRQVEDGDLLAQGIATPLVAAGYLLAKYTHAPQATFASAIGNALCQDGAPLGLSRAEELWLGRALTFFSFGQAACDMLPRLYPKEFLRPAQVDALGNSNNVAVGDYDAPRLRLPGCGGIADVTVHHPHIYLYVPRHSRAVFVETLDFVSGLGVPHPARPGDRPGPHLLVSDLGVFDYAPGRMRLRSYHPGVSIETIRKKTGFELEVAPDVQETPPPSAEEVRLLDEEIDPLGIRALERMSGGRRRRRMREILRIEAQA
ncbi:MAG: ketoacid-CoA transferase [Anaerolineae bacterium]|jgi:acyl CoA:acetate/3-ketoacid CoA transferase beta subunit